MKNKLFKIYLEVLKFILHFTRIKRGKYVILNGAGRSGSNGFVFFKYLKKEHPEIDVTLIEPFPSSHLTWSQWLAIAESEVIFTTHEPFKIKKSQKCVEFWHGIPLKKMGLVANNTNANEQDAMVREWDQLADVVTSSSLFYEKLMTECIGIRPQKYAQVGFPRVDVLYDSELSKTKLLQDLFSQSEHDSSSKIGIYMPTFRWELENNQVMEEIKKGNFFAFADFDGAKLNQQLKENNTFLIVKLHPYEQKSVQLNLDYSNICFLENDYLFKNDLDLYQLLPATDFLITDFSSVYFDYLHLDKPVYFVSNYLDEYLDKRGLLIEPYSKITPGYKCNTQDELLEALSAPDSYVTERQKLLNTSYTLEKQNNCKRIFESLRN